MNKKIICLLIMVITILLCATTISATDNTTKTTEKIDKITTTENQNMETNTKQEPENTKQEIKKTNSENKTVKSSKYPATLSMNSDTMLEGTRLNYKILVKNSSNKPINEGKINFYIDNRYKESKNVNNGVTTINIGYLSAGTHQLKAEFTSDNYKTTTQTKTLTVKSNQVTIDINTNKTIKTTENLIIKNKVYSLDGEPVGNNGYITLYLNNQYVKKEKVNYAQATFNLGKQKEGTYTIKTVYERPQFVTKTQTTTVTVYDVPEIVKLDIPSKTTSDNIMKVVARVTKDNIKVNGGKLKIVANWKTIYENSNLKQGLGAVFYKTPTKPGTYTIVAQYLKNRRLISQDKQSITVTAPTTTLDTPSQSPTDTKIKIIARVKNDNKPVKSGKLKITANWKTIYENPNITQGIGATYYTTPTKAGTYTIVAQYLKNGYLISQTKQNIHVINTESITYEIEGAYSPNEKVKLVARVTKPNGKVNNGNVRFKVGGKVVNTATVKNGVASTYYTLPSYNVHTTSTAEYIKGGTVVASSSQTILTEYPYLTTISAPATAKNGKSITIKAEVNDIFYEAINKGKISFSINDQWIGTTNVKNNVATLNYKVNKNPGTYTLKATYIDSKNKVASETDTQSIKIQKDDTILTTTLKVGEEKQVGTDRFHFYYNAVEEQSGPGAHIYLFRNYDYDDVIPSTYRLLEVKVYYQNFYYRENYTTRTAKAQSASDFSALSTPVLRGFEPYKVDIKYRKMTESEKRENAKYSIL